MCGGIAGEAGERDKSHILKYFLCLRKGPELYSKVSEESLKDFKLKMEFSMFHFRNKHFHSRIKDVFRKGLR